MQGTANKHSERVFSAVFPRLANPFGKRNTARGDVMKLRASQDNIIWQGEDVQLLKLHTFGVWRIKGCWISSEMYRIYSHKDMGSPVSRLTTGSWQIVTFVVSPTKFHLKKKKKNQATGSTLYQRCTSTLSFSKEQFVKPGAISRYWYQVMFASLSLLSLSLHFLLLPLLSFLFFFDREGRSRKRILSLGL